MVVPAGHVGWTGRHSPNRGLDVPDSRSLQQTLVCVLVDWG